MNENALRTITQLLLGTILLFYLPGLTEWIQEENSPTVETNMGKADKYI